MYFSRFSPDYVQANNQLNKELLSNNSSQELFRQLTQTSDSHTENRKTLLVISSQ